MGVGCLSPLDAIREQLGVYQTVRVVDGVYHRFGTNMNGTTPTGRVTVVGQQMRCGLQLPYVGIDAITWPRLSVPVAVAHETARPCPRCFDLPPALIEQLDLFGPAATSTSPTEEVSHGDR
jgi:hypothetical protein